MSGYEQDIHSPNSSGVNHTYDIENEVILETEDKLRVIKAFVLLMIFWTTIISSVILYNAPNYNPHIVLEGIKNEKIDSNVHKNPTYKLMSKFSRENYIELDVALERVGKENPISTNPVHNLKIYVKFSKNRAHIVIKNNDSNEEFKIPYELYNYNDLDMEGYGKIENLNDSNIGIKIYNHPFGFTLYRKDTEEILFDTTHSVGDKNFNTYLYYAENYLQISTKLPEGHYTYGLGDNFDSNLRLDSQVYYFWARDPFQGKEPNFNLEKGTNVYSSFPSFITVNPSTLKSFGVVMFNSSPIKVVLDKQFLTYKMSGGIIDMYIFSGPRLKDVIYQQQKTFGMPLLGKFSDMEWGANVMTNKVNEDLQDIVENKIKNYNAFPIKTFWIDYRKGEIDEGEIQIEQKQKLNESGYGLNLYIVSPLNTKSQYFEYAKKNNICMTNEQGDIYIGKIPNDDNGQYCVLDYYSDNVLEFWNMISSTKYNNTNTRLTLVYNEPSIILQSKEDTNITLPLFKDNMSYLSEGSLPVTAYEGKNSKNSMLYMHNLYSLQEAQIFYNFLLDTNPRPLLFSRSTFIGSQQYTGKYIGYIPPTWAGLRYAIKQTILSNLMGNPNVIHEGCGYSEFSSDTSSKYQAIELNKEVCIRWLQFSSVNLFTRVNNWEIFPLLKEQYAKSLNKTIELRQILNVYMYSYRIKNSIEGGGFILPLFSYCTDYKKEENKDKLFTLETQFMIGTNLMASPISKPNERTKQTYFPNEIFYDFYTGELINPEGEALKDIEAPLDKLPLFARGGFITPVQKSNLGYKNLISMRAQPIQLIVALDRDRQAQGQIMIDDGENGDKKYYRMEFVALFEEEKKEIDLLFRVTKNQYEIPEGMYPKIDQIKIYGIKESPSRVSFDNGNEEVDLSSESIMFDSNLNTMEINTKEINMHFGKEAKYKLLIKDID